MKIARSGPPIDVYIRALRKKLDDLADIVETVRGIGDRCKPLKA